MTATNSLISGPSAGRWESFKYSYNGCVLCQCGFRAFVSRQRKENDFTQQVGKTNSPSPSVAIYVIGRSKEVGGKLCTPVLVLIHAFFSAFMALSVTESRHSLAAAFAWGLVAVMHYTISPLSLIMQVVSQYRELRKKDDLGALSLRSFALQAAVMFVLALRLVIKFGWWPFLDHSKDEVSPDAWDKAATWKIVLVYVAAFWQLDHVSWNYFCWVGGAVLVWWKTVYRRDLRGRDVELEGLLE
jgi:hypothetical protein